MLQHINIKSVLIILIAVFYVKPSVHAQAAINSVQIELGKNGVVANLYYYHTPKDKNYGFRVGAGSNFGKYLREVTGSVGSYYLLGKKINFFEFGIDLGYLSIEENSDDQKGLGLLFPNKPVHGFYGSANLGYRQITGKTLFRIGIAPGLTSKEFVPGAYIGWGFRFY